MRVVVVGAGGLTLGLLCPVLVAAGHQPLIVTRITGSRHERRLRRLADRRHVTVVDRRSEPLDVVPVDGFVDIGTDEGAAELGGLLTGHDRPVVVTAAREGFDSVAGTVGDAAAHGTGPLVVVSADNRPPDSWDALRRARPRNLWCQPSVADRVCIRFPDTNPEADVMVENHRSWVIERDRAGRCDQYFGGSPLVELVDDLRPWRRRKLLCVNGMQLALALLAWDEGHPQLDTWIGAHRPEAEHVANAWGPAYAAYAGEPLADVAMLCQATLERFASTPDRSGRMLGLPEQVATGDPQDLERRVNDRIAPLRTFDATGQIDRVMAIADDTRRRWSAS